MTAAVGQWVAMMLPALHVASEEGGNGFTPPTIGDFFPPAILFEGTWFQIDRIWIIRIVTTIVLVTVFVLAARRAKLVPGRFQAAIEYLLEFVRRQIVYEILGKVEGQRFVPMITTIFFSILAFNITSIVPGLNLAGTSRVGLPLLLALWVMMAYWWAGIRKQGLGGYLKASLFPPVCKQMPLLALIITPIEAVQIFVVRPASLTIRLLANMIAGHIMLVLCFTATEFFLLHASGAFKALSALTLAGGIFVTLFELLVGFLQAYIFSLLAAAYIQMSLEEEH
ncbi:MAG: F0F1 ATP synthase subunit A [Cellulomonadaceae bacterium]|jgi:F-type H+-transporting ATPase subunit a|nr:F0F1 ATP synthase subunit A [Cellulomonadaceae bacterium]